MNTGFIIKGFLGFYFALGDSTIRSALLEGKFFLRKGQWQTCTTKAKKVLWEIWGEKVEED